jgi:hypothetical protein
MELNPVILNQALGLMGNLVEDGDFMGKIKGILPEGTDTNFSMEDIQKKLSETDDVGKLIQDTIESLGLSSDQVDGLKKTFMEKATQGMGGGNGCGTGCNHTHHGPGRAPYKTSHHDTKESGMCLISSPTQEKKVVYVTSTGKLQERFITEQTKQKLIKEWLHMEGKEQEEPLCITCSCLSVANLKDEVIKVWYNPNRIGKNKKITRALGFTVGGEVVIENVTKGLETFDISKSLTYFL